MAERVIARFENHEAAAIEDVARRNSAIESAFNDITAAMQLIIGFFTASIYGYLKTAPGIGRKTLQT